VSGGSRATSALVALLVVSSIGLLLASPANAAQVTGERLVLASDGAARVVLEVQLDVGVNEVRLPAQPVPASIIVEFQGEVLPAIYEPEPAPGVLIIAVEAAGAATISYLAAVTVEDGVITLTYEPVTGEAELVVEPGIVLLSAPATAREYRVEGDRLIIVITGPETIRYTISVEPQEEQPPATETQTQTGTTTQAETQTQTETGAAAGATTTTTTPETPADTAAPEEPAEGGGGGLPLAALAALAAAAALALIALLAWRRRPGPKAAGAPPEAAVEGEEPVELSGEELDDVDRRIVEVLRGAGGELYQSEIQRLTGLPKTTVWRHIRKLSEMGVVEVVREGKANRVKLLRDPFQGG